MVRENHTSPLSKCLYYVTSSPQVLTRVFSVLYTVAIEDSKHYVGMEDGVLQIFSINCLV